MTENFFLSNLKKNLPFINAIFDSASNNGIIIFNKKLKTILWNYGANVLTQYKKNNIKNFEKFISIIQDPKQKNSIKESIDRQADWHGELEIMKSDQSLISIKIMISIIKNRKSDILGILVIFNDITEKILLEEKSRFNQIIIKRDLEFAKKIQELTLSKSFPIRDQIKFDLKYFPSEQLSGDFYYTFNLDTNHVAVCIGDVSGHGVAASLLSTYARNSISPKLLFRNRYMIAKPKEVLTDLNFKLLNLQLKEAPFLTILYSIVDIKNFELTYSNAGAHKVIIINPDTGELKKLGENSFALGWFKEAIYKDDSIKLNNKDRLVYFTDGVIEVFNQKGELFGEDRLCHILTENADKEISEMNNKILESLSEFSGNIKFNDDITILICEICKI